MGYCNYISNKERFLMRAGGGGGRKLAMGNGGPPLAPDRKNAFGHGC